MLRITDQGGRPIYQQVKESLRRLVVTGAVEPGEQLPSVRTLAAQLTINPNTIQRAYSELESEGYVISVPGKGSFARAKPEKNEEKVRQLMTQLEQTAAELLWMGVPAEQLTQRVSAVQCRRCDV